MLNSQLNWNLNKTEFLPKLNSHQNWIISKVEFSAELSSQQIYFCDIFYMISNHCVSREPLFKKVVKSDKKGSFPPAQVQGGKKVTLLLFLDFIERETDFCSWKISVTSIAALIGLECATNWAVEVLCFTTDAPKKAHGVWKLQKKSHSTLRVKRATFTFWVGKSSSRMPKMVKFGEFLKMRHF